MCSFYHIYLKQFSNRFSLSQNLLATVYLKHLISSFQQLNLRSIFANSFLFLNYFDFILFQFLITSKVQICLAIIAEFIDSFSLFINDTVRLSLFLYLVKFTVIRITFVNWSLVVLFGINSSVFHIRIFNLLSRPLFV